MAKGKKKSANTTSSAEVSVQRSKGRGAWRALDTSSALVGALLAPRISNLAWRAVSGRKPPSSSSHPEVSTKEAIAWAAIGGATVQIVRTVLRRGVSTYWVRSTGDLPPGMKHLVDTPKNPSRKTR